MQRLTGVALLAAALPLAAEQTAADPDALKRAFDGAMTCSAVAAVGADTVPQAERWRWDNRSFAFGMLAARFWNDATGEPMTGEQLNDALNRYAEALLEMPADQRAGFEIGCEAKYPDVDKLCESNPCIHAGPPPPPPPPVENS